MEFTTAVELSITDHPTIPFWAAHGKVNVNWILEMEITTSGVKGFTLVVPDQTIKNVSIEVYDEETDEHSIIQTDIELKDIVLEGMFHSGTEDFFNFLRGGIYPKGLELWKNKATLLF
jgi:hypothetical protein